MLPLIARLISPPSPTLRTLKPTPSTVSFTVSTRPERKTVPATLKHWISILIRILFGVAVLLLLWVKWRVSCVQSIDVLLRILGGRQTALMLQIVGQYQWRYMIPGAVAVLFTVVRRGYTEESLTLLRGLGIQTSTSASTFLQAPSSRFIPTTHIQDIIIHEAFKGFEVRFYLAIVVKGEQDVVVVFPSLLPRRSILEEVWRGARKCLWERDGVEQKQQMES